MSFWQRLRTLDGRVLLFSGLLLIAGMVMLMSATAATSVKHGGSAFYFIEHQLTDGVLPGLVLFLIFGLVDYRTWKRFALPALGLSIGALLLVYIPGIGQMRGGSRSWIGLGSFGFQPSELVKLSFLIYVSAWLAAKKGAGAHSLQDGLVPFLLALGSVMLLLILQPDTGSMAVIVGTALALYFVSGAPVSWFLFLCAAGAGIVGLLIRTSPYRAARFMTFMHPELDPLGKGYQINQALLAIGSGGFWGVGYGESRQKFLYLPEVESDSISAIMGEELGFIGIVIFLSLFSLLVWRAIMIAREARDPFGMYLAAGIAAMLSIQLFLNVGSMAGLVPITGVTLPFFSHGGSAMTILLGTIGLLAAIPRGNSRRV
jgi:cell division protein FtsW